MPREQRHSRLKPTAAGAVAYQAGGEMIHSVMMLRKTLEHLNSQPHDSMEDRQCTDTYIEAGFLMWCLPPTRLEKSNHVSKLHFIFFKLVCVSADRTLPSPSLFYYSPVTPTIESITTEGGLIYEKTKSVEQGEPSWGASELRTWAWEGKYLSSLNWVTKCLPKIHTYSEPHDVTLFEKRAFTGVIS